MSIINESGEWVHGCLINKSGKQGHGGSLHYFLQFYVWNFQDKKSKRLPTSILKFYLYLRLTIQNKILADKY